MLGPADELRAPRSSRLHHHAPRTAAPAPRRTSLLLRLSYSTMLSTRSSVTAATSRRRISRSSSATTTRSIRGSPMQTPSDDRLSSCSLHGGARPSATRCDAAAPGRDARRQTVESWIRGMSAYGYGLRPSSAPARSVIRRRVVIEQRVYNY